MRDLGLKAELVLRCVLGGGIRGKRRRLAMLNAYREVYLVCEILSLFALSVADIVTNSGVGQLRGWRRCCGSGEQVEVFVA